MYVSTWAAVNSAGVAGGYSKPPRNRTKRPNIVHDEAVDARVRRLPVGPTRCANSAANAGCQPGNGNSPTVKTLLRPSSPSTATVRPIAVLATSGGGS